MTFNEYRKKLRRQKERRTNERRLVNLVFMSPEWISRIQEENLLWPKQDRRIEDRRSASRRSNSRRGKSVRVKKPTTATYPGNLLSAEEKKMLNDLMKPSDNEH